MAFPNRKTIAGSLAMHMNARQNRWQTRHLLRL